MWWRQPKVYLRIIIYVGILALVWFKLRPLIQIGRLPIKAELSDVVEGYFQDGVRVEEGMKYMSIGFFLQAAAGGEYRIEEDQFRLVDKSGRVYLPVSGSLELPGLSDSYWRFESGDALAGRVVFMVPEEAEPDRLAIKPPSVKTKSRQD